MYDTLQNLDRRWIFLLMGLAVAVPILFQLEFPETPTSLAQATFDEIESLRPGDRVLMAWDYDPASEGELGPMATSFARHCCEKRLRLYFIALWPVGQQMIDNTIEKVIRPDFPEMVYGEDYVNLGFKKGEEGVIKVIVTDLPNLYPTDARGTGLNQIPMCRDLESIQQMKLIVNVSAGYPGTKEWVQYATTPYPNTRIVAGCTGVQAPLFYPYIPEQLPGMLGAIKGAAEYEALVNAKYSPAGAVPAKYLEAKRRMGPQLVAHLLMIGLIITGNVLYFVGRRRAG
ncbi:MAG: hypothetical protein JNG89_05165 [Planctomycetaceae bacterium]|nr:hypothetical protein [Planctomycetaceae bacterium]